MCCLLISGKNSSVLNLAPGVVFNSRQHITSYGHQVRVERLWFVWFFNKFNNTANLSFHFQAIFGFWEELERTEPGAWGRIQLTDAIAALAKKQSVDAMLMTERLWFVWFFNKFNNTANLSFHFQAIFGLNDGIF
jgi:hypothetical protein